MTSCSDCLNALSSARVVDISPGSSIAIHCATCPQCMRVADEVRYAEYRLAASLSEERPRFSSEEVAIAAIDGSELRRRRRIGRWVRGVLALIALGIFGAAMEARFEGNNRRGKNVVTETIPLRCLSAAQAADLVTPYLRHSGSAVYRSDEIRMITIRGTTDDVFKAKMTIDAIDQTGACARLPGTPVPATSDAVPGKD
ncbi:MAG: hypothetical protein ABI556_08825 [Gemmatimonadales bacterium]